MILADAVQSGGKATGGQAAHGVAQAVKQRHSANHIGNRSQNQKNDVHFKNGLGGLLEVRHQLVGMPLCVEQIHRALAGHQHDHHQHEAQAAAVLHEAPVEQEDVGGLCHIHHGKSGGCPAADGFKERLHEFQLPRKEEGHGTDCNSPEPGKKHGVIAVPLSSQTVRAEIGFPLPKGAYKTPCQDREQPGQQKVDCIANVLRIERENCHRGDDQQTDHDHQLAAVGAVFHFCHLASPPFNSRIAISSCSFPEIRTRMSPARIRVSPLGIRV